MSLLKPYLSAKVKEPSFSAGTFISMFTFLNSSVLCCPEEGNETSYSPVMLSTHLGAPEESMGTIRPHVSSFDCTSTVLFKVISNQEVLQGAYWLCPMMSAYCLHTRTILTFVKRLLRVLSYQQCLSNQDSICTKSVLRGYLSGYKPRANTKQLGGEGKGSQYHKHDGLTPKTGRKQDFFWAGI